MAQNPENAQQESEFLSSKKVEKLTEPYEQDGQLVKVYVCLPIEEKMFCKL